MNKFFNVFLIILTVSSLTSCVNENKKINLIIKKDMSSNMSEQNKLLLSDKNQIAYTLRFIGDYNIDSKTKVGEKKPTILGGLSGIVYSGKDNIFFVTSDDRGKKGDPRYYPIEIDFFQNKIKVNPKDAVMFRNIDNTDFEPGGVDFEGISMLPNGNLIISSEGDIHETPAINPAIYEFTKEGHYVKNWSLPYKFLPSKKMPRTKGSHNNRSLECLSITNDGKYVFTASESSLIQDGSKASKEEGTRTRILRYKHDGSNYTPETEYAYELSKLPNPTGLSQVSGSNGLVDIAAISKNKLLTLERSFIRETITNYVKIYLTEFLPNTSEIQELESIKNKKITLAKKTLVLNLNDIIPQMNPLLQKLDNLEGIAIGPRLENGNQTLVVVGDNNFSPYQRTLFIAFEIIESIAN